MKGYKAFGKGLICRGKQYAENTVFEEEGKAVPCKSGMHFCENPLDVLNFYNLVGENGDFAEFAEVEADEVATDDNKKFCTTRLKIGAKLSLKGFIDSAIEFLFERTRNIETNSGYGAQLASSGNYAQLASSRIYGQL
jgi:hypothetical protein